MADEPITADAQTRGPLKTNIPQRMDRLPWSRWHWLIVIGAGRHLAARRTGSVYRRRARPRAHPSDTLDLTESQVGLTASAYLAGSVFGARRLFLSYRSAGKKKMVHDHAAALSGATVLTAFSWDLWPVSCVFRFLTGAGIGGEYAAINSAIDELIPAAARGHTDLAINGTWWLGSAAGALLSLLLLNPHARP